MKNISRYAVILGSLLHDIGKFVQRAQENSKGQDHQYWGTKWFEYNLAEKLTPVFTIQEKDIILSAINNHHGFEEYVTLADAASAGMDRIKLKDEEKGDPFTDRLISIFTRVFISEMPRKEMYHKLAPLGQENLKEIFPIEDKKSDHTEYNNLLTLFNEEIKKLNFSSPMQTIEQIYFLLWKYTWCIPSATYENEPDISLFDHLKTTAAIASCLYDYHQKHSNETLDLNSPAFLLVGGDISGIQKFIYSLASPEEAQKGQTQRLRGRSFYLSLLSETMAHFILKKLELSIVNLLWCGGGHFLILAPNIENNIKILNECGQKINNFLLNLFHADLYLAISSLNVNSHGLKNFNESLEKLEKELINMKKRKFVHIHQRKFELKDDVCIVCGSDFKKNSDEKICEMCNLYERIGQKIPYSNYLIETNFPLNFETEIKFDNFDIYWNLSEDLRKIPNNSKVYKINDTNFLNSQGNYSLCGFKFFAKTVAMKDDRILTTEEMQNENTGGKFLGILRMDVDNLGLIFSLGLGENTSVSRVATLSRALDAFFLGYLNNICKEYKTLYITYSGGDDLLIIGGWEEIVSVSQKISDEFKRYCENDDIHLSAGIFLCKYKFPIGRAANLSGEKLDGIAKKLPGKNAISIFDRATYWDIFKEVISLGDEMIRYINNKKLSRSFVFSLLEIYQTHIKEKTEELIWLPKFLYTLKRNVEKKNDQEMLNLAISLKEKIPKLRHQIPILVSYVLLKTRKEG